MTLVVCVLGVGTALAVWATPQIVGLYSSDTSGRHEAFQLTVVFARFLLPQIFFYGLFGIYGQVLNAREKFGAMMWTPVLNNVVLIGMFGAYLCFVTVPQRVEDITADPCAAFWVSAPQPGSPLQALALIPFVTGRRLPVPPALRLARHRPGHEHPRREGGPCCSSLPTRSPTP